jgi:hypothetical protein
VAYLSTARTAATVHELEDEEALKRKGILVGQHVPTLPSKLELQEDALVLRADNKSAVSFEFVLPRAVLQDNHLSTLRRTGQMPISAQAEEYTNRRLHNHVTMQTETPNYLASTRGFDVRTSINKGRRRRDSPVPTTILDSSLITVKGKPKSSSKGPSMAEEVINESVLKSMNLKLSYLRNPRNVVTMVSKTLTKKEPPQATDSQLITMPTFIAVPGSLEFMGFEVGVTKTLVLTLRNVSTVMRNVRLWPPKTQVSALA